MSFIAAAAISAGGAIAGGLISANAASSAAQAQLKASREANAAQERMFNKQVELQTPWREAGQNALNKLIPIASEYTPFGMAQFQADPGYAFRLQEGLKALDRTAAARGGMLGGNQLRGAVEYGQNLGAQEYTNAFNRYQTERAARLNPLQSLAGVGQSATNTLTNAAGAYGQQMGENAINAGNARASGYVGQANAINQALGGIGNAAINYGNWNNQQNMLNNYLAWAQPVSNGMENLPAYPGMK